MKMKYLDVLIDACNYVGDEDETTDTRKQSL